MSRSSLVEQAIYTSAQTTRGDGYQLVACSPGVSDEAQRALPAWCPSHDALLPDLRVPRSVNFFHLSSGEACIARTISAGQDFSLRGAARLVTHILIVQRDVLSRFSGDPFSLLRAVEVSGQLAHVDSISSFCIPPIPLLGRASAVQPAVIGELLARVGAARLAFALESLLAKRPLAIRADCDTELLFAALLQLLPVECRSVFSFSTGLQYSPRRPFDLVALPNDPRARRRLAQTHRLHTLDLTRLAETAITPGGWANHVALSLAHGGVASLAAELHQKRPGLTVSDLPALAAELENQRRHSKSIEQTTGPANFYEVVCDSEYRRNVAHAHGAHPRHQNSSAAKESPLNSAQTTPPPHTAPSNLLAKSLALSSPLQEHSQLLEQLERLDDVVFAALAGRAGALADLRTLWPYVLSELPGDLIEESREHYLMHAHRLWESFVQNGRSPELAIAALDVLTLLCGEQ